MFKSTLSSKGQVTIPKEIRELLRLDSGSTVLFNVLSDKVIIEKDLERLVCPVCNGSCKFETIELPCFVCDQTGYVDNSEAIPQVHLLLKHKVAVKLITQGFDYKNNEFEYKEIPVLTLTSNIYPASIMDAANDYYQMKLIEEYSPRRTQDLHQFMSPSDVLLNKILSLLRLEESKVIVRKWFRYE